MEYASKATVDDDVTDFGHDVVEGRPFSWVVGPAKSLELLQRWWSGFVGLPCQSLGFDLAEDGVVAEFAEGHFALVEDLPEQTGVGVDVALGGVLVLEDDLVREPSQGDDLVAVLGVLLLVGFLAHAEEGDLEGEVAGDEAVAGGDVLVDEAVVREVFETSGCLAREGDDLRDGELGRAFLGLVAGAGGGGLVFERERLVGRQL